MIYLTKEDWITLILSKITKKEGFNQHFCELFKIHKAFLIFIKKIYDYLSQEEQTLLFIASTVIFHKYRICTNFTINNSSSEEIYILICACLSIGQIVTNILLRSLKTISKFIEVEIVKKAPNKKNILNIIIDKLKEKQFEILSTLGFNTDVDFPFYFLNKVKTHLSNISNLPKNFILLLNSIIKESFIMPFCLYYTPNIIIISAVSILKEKFNLNYINLKELISLSEYDLDEEEIQECASLLKVLDAAVVQIMEEKKNVQKTSNNTSTIIKSDITQMNSDKNTITKIIPSIKMNME